MTKEKTLDTFKALGLLAVIRMSTPDTTHRMVEALVEGGVYGIPIRYSLPKAFVLVKDLDK